MVSNHFEDPFLKILPKLDLHGETEDLAGYIIQEFIKENRLTGNLKVQIIHGRHGGVLKKRLMKF